MPDSLEAHLLNQTDQATRLFWHRLRWRYVAGHLPAGAFTLLDIGAGAGVTGRFLARDRPEATYTFDEPIESLRNQLRGEFGTAADLADVNPLPPVHVVTLLDVLEHIEDDRAFLERLVDRLAHGTEIIITVPARMRFWSGWDVALGHQRRYEPDEFATLLSSVPVEVQEIGNLFPEMIPAAWWRARRKPAYETDPDSDRIHSTEADFPDLPRVLDTALYLLGLPGIGLRTRLPIGTSLCAVVEVRHP